MSATQQNLVNAMVQEQLKILEQHFNSCTKNLNERLEKLESEALARANESGGTNVPYRSKSTRRLSTAMENTIRLSSHEQLADLVVELCHHDDTTQNLACSLLLDGEGDTDMSGPPSPQALASGSSKRRASGAVGPAKRCNRCGKDCTVPSWPRSTLNDCHYHPGNSCYYSTHTIKSC
jgi:hypothetical protein